MALEEAAFTSDRIPRRQWVHHLGSATATVLVGAVTGTVDAAVVVLYRRNTRVARLYSLAVADPARGIGLGGVLLAAAEADARARGCTAMHLEVQTDNAPALALYARHGYAPIARLVHFYETGADAWRYGKRLVPAGV